MIIVMVTECHGCYTSIQENMWTFSPFRQDLPDSPGSNEHLLMIASQLPEAGTTLTCLQDKFLNLFNLKKINHSFCVIIQKFFHRTIKFLQTIYFYSYFLVLHCIFVFYSCNFIEVWFINFNGFSISFNLCIFVS